MTDFELLHDYGTQGLDDAFTVLTKRYVDLVYSAAMRQAGNPHAAEEITQAVFLVLARKANEISEDTVLSAWLLRTTRFVALNAWRREVRRMKLEYNAMNLYPTEGDAAWKQIAPMLDEALVRLSQKDRDAVALRFFEEKSFKEIGRILGTTEDSAQKRVARAMEKLRADFAKRGTALSAALLVVALAGRTVQAAPADLVASTAVALASGSGPASALMQLTLAAWQAARIKTLALQGAAVVCVVLLLVTVYQFKTSVLKGNSRLTTADSAVAVATDLAPAPDSNLVPAAIAESKTNSGGLFFRVVDAESGKPVGNARLTLVWTADFANDATNVVLTDAQGTSLFGVDRTPVKNWRLRIEVFRDGYVPKYVSWSEAQRDELKDIPAEYTTKLERAVEIGGMVANDKGEPVSGARVALSSPFYHRRDAIAERECLTIGANYHAETTGADGHWHCHHVPDDFSMIEFAVLHPNYVPVRFSPAKMPATLTTDGKYVAEHELRRGIATTTLRPGLSVSGVVEDQLGNPIVRAKVTQDTRWDDPTASQLTGPGGRFQFLNAVPSLFSLTVQAEGFAPTDREVKVSNPAPTPSFSFGAPAVWTTGRIAEATAILAKEFRFVLTNGGLLRGRLVDEQDRPVVKANVQISSHSNVRRFEWQTTTDEQGKFEWDSAPPSPELYIITAPAYEVLGEVKWTADGSEHLVTMRTLPGPVRVFGTAVDAETRKPLEHFRVLMSGSRRKQSSYGNASVESFPSFLLAAGRAGQFSCTNSDGALSWYALEAHADGYWPARVTGRGPMTNDAEFQFELKPGLVLKGILQAPDGKPVADATAFLCTEQRGSNPTALERAGVYMKLPGQFDLPYSAPYTKTDTEGRFSFAPKFGARLILFAHETGFVAVPVQQLAESPLVNLQPWGRVRGTLKIGDRPGSGKTISLYAAQRGFEDWNGMSVFLETKTDADGAFVIEGVPPGDFHVAHRLSFRDGQMGAIPNSQETRIHVKAGETTEVTLGGVGRKVVGKLKMQRPGQKVDWQAEVQTLTARISEPPAPRWSEFKSRPEYEKAAEQWRASQREFWQSESGQKMHRNWRRYVLEMNPDGTFIIEDVIPGTYELFIRSLVSGKLTRQDVIVPEAGEGADPLDIGTIELN